MNAIKIKKKELRRIKFQNNGTSLTRVADLTILNVSEDKTCSKV